MRRKQEWLEGFLLCEWIRGTSAVKTGTREGVWGGNRRAQLLGQCLQPTDSWSCCYRRELAAPRRCLKAREGMRSAGEMVGKDRRGGQTCGQTQDGLGSLKGARASMQNWTGQLVGFTETQQCWWRPHWCTEQGDGYRVITQAPSTLPAS